MKKLLIIASMLGLAWCPSAPCAVLYSWSGSTDIPDYDAGTGASGLAMSFSPDAAGSGIISDLSISFTITGGYNGDLFAYLSSSSGGYTVLLDRPGLGTGTAGSLTYNYGFGGAGFDVTLSDSGADVNINDYAETAGQQVAGSFTPAGSGGTSFSSFGSVNPGDVWTLYFVDENAGGQSTLTDFGINADVIPEPANKALGIFGALAALVALARSKLARRWLGLQTACEASKKSLLRNT